jgi:hypothetical protein
VIYFLLGVCELYALKDHSDSEGSTPKPANREAIHVHFQGYSNNCPRGANRRSVSGDLFASGASLSVFINFLTVRISTYQATCALLNGVVFASYRFFMKLQLQHDKGVPSLYQIMLAGIGSGIVSSYVNHPCVVRSINGTIAQFRWRQRCHNAD